MFAEWKPKLLGGFTKYYNPYSSIYHGRRSEWGTFLNESQDEGIAYFEWSKGYCNYDHGGGYCRTFLIFSTWPDEVRQRYDIKGSYVKFADDGRVTMSWNFALIGQGLIDQIVVNAVVYDTDEIFRTAEHHIILEPIQGPFDFDDISHKACSRTSPASCSHEYFRLERRLVVTEGSTAYLIMKVREYSAQLSAPEHHTYIWM